jgi:hypothetical protein
MAAPSYISISLGDGQIQLGECADYLAHISSMAQCQFTR